MVISNLIVKESAGATLCPLPDRSKNPFLKWQEEMKNDK